MLAERNRIIAEAEAAFAADAVQAGIDLLRRLEGLTVDEDALSRTDPFFARVAAGRRVVASFDPRRRPAADEVVILYGNYPHAFENIVVNNPIKRHVADFWSFAHDGVEYDSRWERVEKIYVINKDDRPDRLDSILRELVMARAPLDRVVRVPAVLPDPSWTWTEKHATRDAAGQLACLLSHVTALKLARDAGARNVLILEDDFCFTSDLDDHLDDLDEFLSRDEEYWICLVATSKYGAIVPKDGLVSFSHQECTNTGGYLVSRTGIEKVLPVFDEAQRALRKEGNAKRYAVDRCWSVLQPSGKFLVFRRKFGFQMSTFSDIERSISRYLD